MLNILCCFCYPQQYPSSISAWIIASLVRLWYCGATIIWGSQVTQAAGSVEKDIISFALKSPSASEMLNWLLDNSETGLPWVWVCMKNGGVFERQNVWDGQEMNKRQPAMLSKTEKPRPFGVFFSIVVHYEPDSWVSSTKQVPFRAVHHWLFCHFTLVSSWRTAAPKGLDTLVMKEAFWTHTHIHIHTFDKDVLDKVGKIGTQGEPLSKLLIVL